MDIATAYSNLVTTLGALSITTPVPQSMARVYTWRPDATKAIDTPCVMASWTLTSLNVPAFGYRKQRYTVTLQGFMAEQQQNQALAIATAFYVALVDALCADPRLSESVTQWSDLRSNDPALVGLDWNGLSYYGWQLYLDLQMDEAFP